ncbi:MAG TPA: FAD-binding oxidoreductase [Actinomycetota bacterium]|jgi:FAD/FMN-containing dehydrogenase|nr:FAD-binding oxidoreductase [Actinomycetota bacterium]
MAVPTAERIGALRERMSGPVVAPGDQEYDEIRKVHNGLVDKYPSLIARCTNTADVVAAVKLGREAGLEISVRGGGHNVAGKAVTDGGLMIDLSLMKAVGIMQGTGGSPVGHVEWTNVRAEGGVTWGELNDVTHADGLATPGGVVSTTGIAGLTLGGGFGWIQGKYGMAVDNLVEAKMVLASGEIVVAREASEPDLFWAIRGGGGNFGVATSFEYRAYPLTTVLGGIVAHPLESAVDLMRLYREVTASASDDMTVFFGIVHAPDGSGTKLSALVVCHVGDEDDAAREVKPIKEFGPPIMDAIERIPYPVQNTLLDAGYPRGALNYWKSGFFSELSDEVAEKMAAALERAPHPLCGMAIEQFHGKVTRVPVTATAFPHREPGFNLILTGVWEDHAQTEECIAWTRETFESLRPHMSDRVYVNYLDKDDGTRVTSAYGPNYDRLVEVKRRYDPDNVFRLNANIVP